MEPRSGSPDPELDRDVKDLWTAVLNLGENIEEYEPATGSTALRFRRGTEWKSALDTIRTLLNKYHSHADLPMRVHLHKWRVISGRLLPMIARHHEDR